MEWKGKGHIQLKQIDFKSNIRRKMLRMEKERKLQFYRGSFLQGSCLALYFMFSSDFFPMTCPMATAICYAMPYELTLLVPPLYWEERNAYDVFHWQTFSYGICWRLFECFRCFTAGFRELSAYIFWLWRWVGIEKKGTYCIVFFLRQILLTATYYLANFVFRTYFILHS